MTQHHANLDDMEDEEEEVIEIQVNLVDRPFLIQNLEIFLTQPIEIIYE